MEREESPPRNEWAQEKIEGEEIKACPLAIWFIG